MFKYIVIALVFLATACVPVVTPDVVYPTYMATQTKDFTITAVPYLTHEMAGTYDYLNADFADGGVLAGKEVYGFSPSTLVVYAGDTVHLTLVNPEDDPHTFTIPDLGVNAQMDAQSTSDVTFTVDQAGVYTFVCGEAEHMPYMYGQLVVLAN